MEKRALRGIQIASAVVTIAVGAIAVWTFLERTYTPDINGAWIVSDRIEKAASRPRLGTERTYHVLVTQRETAVEGFGEKLCVDGRKLDRTAHVDLDLKGVVKRQIAYLNFKGTPRSAEHSGQFKWVVTAADRFVGQFVSEDARTVGIVAGKRLRDVFTCQAAPTLDPYGRERG